MSKQDEHKQKPIYTASDSFMGIFGYKRVGTKSAKLNRIRQEAEISDLMETKLYKTV